MASLSLCRPFQEYLDLAVPMVQYSEVNPSASVGFFDTT